MLHLLAGRSRSLGQQPGKHGYRRLIAWPVSPLDYFLLVPCPLAPNPGDATGPGPGKVHPDAWNRSCFPVDAASHVVSCWHVTLDTVRGSERCGPATEVWWCCHGNCFQALAVAVSVMYVVALCQMMDGSAGQEVFGLTDWNPPRTDRAWTACDLSFPSETPTYCKAVWSAIVGGGVVSVLASVNVGPVTTWMGDCSRAG